MQITGYDADKMTKVLAALDSISPMNGIFTKYVDAETIRLLVAAGFAWECEDGDLFEDSARFDWSIRGGDVRELAQILNLDIQISL